MLFNEDDVRNILEQFDAGFEPVQILYDLYRNGFTRGIKLAAVEQCLLDNGRDISNNQMSYAAAAHDDHHDSHDEVDEADHASNPSPSASTNHSPPSPPPPPAAASNQGTRQVYSTYVPVRDTTTTTDHHVLYDAASSTMTFWNDQADQNTTTTTDHHALYDPGSTVTWNNQADRNSTSDAVLCDPGTSTMTWNDQADRFAISAHRYGKSVDEIWAILLNNGYDIAKTEVIESLTWQGVFLSTTTGN